MSPVSLFTMLGKPPFDVATTTSECSLELLSLPTSSTVVTPIDSNGGLEAIVVLFVCVSSGGTILSALSLGRVLELSLSHSDESEEENSLSRFLCFALEDFVVLDTGGTGVVIISSLSPLSSLNLSGSLI